MAGLGTVIKDAELGIMVADDVKQKLEVFVIHANEEDEIQKRNEKLALLKEDNQSKRQLDKLISVLQDTELGK